MLTDSGRAYEIEVVGHWVEKSACGRSSPTFHAFADRLRNNGKSKMAVIGAVMHKLIHVI